MSFDFVNTIPTDFSKVPVVISGSRSLSFKGIEYLVVKENGVQEVFAIRFGYRCSPFKEALITGALLAVGHEGYFYLYDLERQINLTAIEMDGYFGHFYFHNNCFFVTSAGSVYCLDNQGTLLWKNSNIGIDGVIIDHFAEGKIYGSGEWDPPGGWQDFVLDMETGMRLKEAKT